MLVSVALVLLSQTGTIEGTLTVKPGAAGGSPEAFIAKNALLFVEGYEEPGGKREPPKVVKQRGRSFSPQVSWVLKHKRVVFDNDDTENIFHHVFSPSKPNAFTTEKFTSGEKRERWFDAYGRVDIFCDIHKEMNATVWVVPNRAVALVDAEGSSAPFAIANVKPGKHVLVAWHRSAERPVELPVEVKPGQVTKVDVVIEGGTGLERLLNHKRINGQAYPADKNDPDVLRRQSTRNW